MVKILFVCLGNICRSPTAHGIFEQMLQNKNLQESIQCDSCGTGAWHVGESPDERAQQMAIGKGYDLSHLRARRIESEDYYEFDYILAMDTRNLADVITKVPNDFSGELRLFLDYSPDNAITEVPDPYQGEKESFERVFNIIESACVGLLADINKKYS